jgi:hypothetical protein
MSAGRPPRRPPGAPAPAATANAAAPVVVAHCREILRLAEAGEIVNLVATARYAGRSVWKCAAAGRFDPIIVDQIAIRFQAIVRGHAAEILGNVALALPEAPR